MNTIDGLKIVLEFYKELGFERLPLEVRSQKSEVRSQKKISSTHHAVGRDKAAALETLRGEIGDCQRCKLSKERTHIVFGEGNANAKIMFIGEAPGREEDLQARPFVGDAGQLLTRLIERMGFKREDVYIANIVKCRPPMNRDPQDDEMSTCFPFLDRQIEIISPEVIVSLGKISAYMLMGVKVPISKFSITKVRGRFYEYKGIPVMPTFHPAYLLRNPKDKWFTWEDAQAVLKKLRN
jgi:DNA polymerase